MALTSLLSGGGSISIARGGGGENNGCGFDVCVHSPSEFDESEQLDGQCRKKKKRRIQGRGWLGWRASHESR